MIRNARRVIIDAGAPRPSTKSVAAIAHLTTSEDNPVEIGEIKGAPCGVRTTDPLIRSTTALARGHPALRAGRKACAVGRGPEGAGEGAGDPEGEAAFRDAARMVH